MSEQKTVSERWLEKYSMPVEMDRALQGFIHTNQDLGRSPISFGNACARFVLLWLAENPTMPSDEDIQASRPTILEQGAASNEISKWPETRRHCVDWQQRMFLRKPDPLSEVGQLLKGVVEGYVSANISGPDGPRVNVNMALADWKAIEARHLTELGASRKHDLGGE